MVCSRGCDIYYVPRVMHIAVHDTSTISLFQREAGVAGLGGARGLGHSSSILCGGNGRQENKKAIQQSGVGREGGS